MSMPISRVGVAVMTLGASAASPVLNAVSRSSCPVRPSMPVCSPVTTRRGRAGAVEAAVVVIVLGGQQFEVAGAAVAQAVCAFPPVGAVGWGGVACSAGVAAEQ